MSRQKTGFKVLPGDIGVFELSVESETIEMYFRGLDRGELLDLNEKIAAALTVDLDRRIVAGLGRG